MGLSYLHLQPSEAPPELSSGPFRAANERAIVTKANKGRGGVPFGRGSLRHLLQNPIYLGEVHFKNAVRDGDGDGDGDGGEVQAGAEQARGDAEVLLNGAPQQARALILQYVERVNLGDQCLRIQLRAVLNRPSAVLTASIGRLRCGNDTRIIIKDAPVPSTPADQQLVQVLADARAAQQLAIAQPGKTLAELATIVNMPPLRLKQLLRLSYLAPSVVADIMIGNTPAAITRSGLRNLTNIAPAWDAQRRGFELA